MSIKSMPKFSVYSRLQVLYIQSTRMNERANGSIINAPAHEILALIEYAQKPSLNTMLAYPAGLNFV